MDKDTSEIVKLTERISKDPKSKLFVPLAEEYKKTGDIEMAIHVLSEGLKNNPSYVTARSLLGRLLYENGDLVAAQKEFEEVVKAIPDNLLAQRKLGDLYSLQNNHTEALKHYRIALALNPDDKSCAALVSKLEENLGIKAKPEVRKGPLASSSGSALEPERPSASDMSVPTIPTPQVSSSATEERQSKQESTSTLKPDPSVRTVELTKEKSAETSVQQEQASEPPSAQKEPFLSPMPVKHNLLAETEQALESFDTSSEVEEPEEVLTVEPIEEEGVPEEPFSAEKPFSGENIFDNRSSDGLTAETDNSISEHELPDVESEPSGNQEPAVTVAPETDVQVKVFKPKLSDKQPADESDDFTTDTLAELYIAQGFYEKAIDIYERMMADHPDNLGLVEKLERVKTMALVNPPEEYASTVVHSFESLGEKIETSVSEGPKEYTGPQETPKKTDEPLAAKGPGEISESTVLSGDQETPPLQDDNRTSLLSSHETYLQEEHNEGVAAIPITEDIEAKSIFQGSKEFKLKAGTEELNQDVTEVPTTDFKLREYMPLDISSSETEVEQVNSTPQQSIKNRKETIERLETWLKNIKKEK